MILREFKNRCREAVIYGSSKAFNVNERNVVFLEKLLKRIFRNETFGMWLKPHGPGYVIISDANRVV